MYNQTFLSKLFYNTEYIFGIRLTHNMTQYIWTTKHFQSKITANSNKSHFPELEHEKIFLKLSTSIKDGNEKL